MSDDLVNNAFATAPTGAAYRRGQSKQDYQTPHDFMRAVHELFDEPVVDLAASKTNAQAKAWIDEARDSLTVDWYAEHGARWSPLAWLNPPYGNITPWARKCAETVANQTDDAKRLRIAMLVPASVSTNWWAEYVHDKCRVYFLRPRLTFVGAKDPYPRDLALCVYSHQHRGGYEPWRWK